MTIELQREQALFDEATTVPVRVVDGDVHPVPKIGELTGFIPEPFRSRFEARAEGAGIPVYYDPPDFGHSGAMRTDSFPADGNPAGSDPALLFEQLIMNAGTDIAILGPATGSPGQTGEEMHALAVGTNLWQEECWISSKINWHKRFRASIVVSIEAPAAAAREIEFWAEHEYFSQVLIDAEPRPAWGDPIYDPVWAAAVKHDIPVACHLNRGRHNLLPMSPVGFMTYNHDLMVSYSMLAANQVMSLIFDGVFDRFPTLQIVFIEHAFNWILPLMWRMDAMYAKHGVPETGLKRKPSDYVKSNIWFTTQPLDYPEDKLELTNALEWMEADKLLLFSSDYPHWTFDDPQWVSKHMPMHMRDAIMFQNGLDLFHLPNEVPALPGQKRAY